MASDQQKPRTLSAREFDALTARVLASAPKGMSEADYQRWIGPAMETAIAQWESRPEVVNLDSSLRRAVTSAARTLNPVNMLEGGLEALTHPIQTGKDIWAAMGDQASKARTAAREGRYVEAAGHGVASAVPVLGPAAAASGEQIAQGDVASGIGSGTALLAVSSPSALRGAAGAVQRVIPENLRARTATALERGASERVAGVMRPEVGPNKTRFGNIAADVAPDLVERGMARGWSREGLHARVQDAFELAKQELDAAADARLSARSFQTAPAIEALKAKRASLTAHAVEASEYPRSLHARVSDILDAQGKPIVVEDALSRPLGKDVVPQDNAAQVAKIDAAIEELQQLGPRATYEAIKRIRQSFDKTAKVRYAPSMTADYLKLQGEAMGAADVTGVLREFLGKADPRTAKANAAYSLFKSADDVMTAAAEVERTRPKVGRRIMARLTGTLGGGHVAGAPGAAAGFVLAPVIEAATSGGVTVRLQTARLMSTLAKAIQKGDEAKTISLIKQLEHLGARAVQVQGGSTSPSARPSSMLPVTR